MLHANVTSWGYVAPEGPSNWDGFIGSGLFERRMQWLGTRDLSGFLAVPAAIEFQQAHDWPRSVNAVIPWPSICCIVWRTHGLGADCARRKSRPDGAAGHHSPACCGPARAPV